MNVDTASGPLAPVLLSCLEGMITAMAVRDLQTVVHQERTAALSLRLADRVGLPASRRGLLRTAARVHDIGKLGVPVEILHVPRELTAVERHAIESHAVLGAQMLRRLGLPFELCEIVQSHHERLDGSGYPYGLEGDEISREARILAVADVVDAMLSPQPNRPPRTIEEIEATLGRGRGKRFDADVVDAALGYLDERSRGSCVDCEPDAGSWSIAC